MEMLCNSAPLMIAHSPLPAVVRRRFSVIFLDAARAASLFVFILALLLVCLIVQVCLLAMIPAAVLVPALGAGLLVLKFCIRTKEPLPIQ